MSDRKRQWVSASKQADETEAELERLDNGGFTTANELFFATFKAEQLAVYLDGSKRSTDERLCRMREHYAERFPMHGPKNQNDRAAPARTKEIPWPMCRGEIEGYHGEC